MATQPAAEISVPAARGRKRVAESHFARYERLESNIGEGTYGKVHKARDAKTGRVVAIKKAKISAMGRDVGGIEFTVLREIKLMQAVQHPNVMYCLDVFAERDAINLVMEFMDGDLRKLIEEKGVVFTEPHVKCLAKQLLEGLGALHSSFFVHRDITLNNILVNFSTGVAKLTDFGSARTIGHRERPLTSTVTTLWYRAPELFFGAQYYGQAVDFWSMGCVLAELFLRQPLFPGRREFDMLQKIIDKRGSPSEEVWKDMEALPNFMEFPDHPKQPLATVLPGVSSSAQSLIDGLLSWDPKQRPTAAEALSHEFFTTARPLACKPQDLPFVSAAGSKAS